MGTPGQPIHCAGCWAGTKRWAGSQPLGMWNDGPEPPFRSQQWPPAPSLPTTVGSRLVSFPFPSPYTWYKKDPATVPLPCSPPHSRTTQPASLLGSRNSQSGLKLPTSSLIFCPSLSLHSSSRPSSATYRDVLLMPWSLYILRQSLVSSMKPFLSTCVLRSLSPLNSFSL